MFCLLDKIMEEKCIYRIFHVNFPIYHFFCSLIVFVDLSYHLCYFFLIWQTSFSIICKQLCWQILLVLFYLGISLFHLHF